MKVGDGCMEVHYLTLLSDWTELNWSCTGLLSNLFWDKEMSEVRWARNERCFTLSAKHQDRYAGHVTFMEHCFLFPLEERENTFLRAVTWWLLFVTALAAPSHQLVILTFHTSNARIQIIRIFLHVYPTSQILHVLFQLAKIWGQCYNL